MANIVVICNDLDFKTIAVQNLPIFEEKGFVVMRTLFLEYLDAEEKKLMDICELRATFEEHGLVESVVQYYQKAKDNGRKPYGYITYFNSIDALAAIGRIQADTDLKFRVQPADTWHQPQQAQADVDFEALDERPSTPDSNAGGEQPDNEADQYNYEIEDVDPLHANQFEAHEYNQPAPPYNEMIDEIVSVDGLESEDEEMNHIFETLSKGFGDEQKKQATAGNQSGTMKRESPIDSETRLSAYTSPNEAFLILGDAKTESARSSRNPTPTCEPSTSNNQQPSGKISPLLQHLMNHKTLTRSYSNRSNSPVDANRPALNDDCLIRILSLCDVPTLLTAMHTSLHVRDLIRLASLNRFESYSIKFDDDEVNLRSIRNSLRFIGKNVKQLTIVIPFYEKPVNINRILYKIGQYVNTKIESLIVSYYWLTDSNLEQLKPLLRRLKSLDLIYMDRGGELASLQQYCPNLERLHVNGTITFNEQLENWPNLTNMKVQYEQRSRFLRFLQIACTNNPQLKAINVYADQDNIIEGLKFIAARLPNVEKMQLDVYNTENDDYLSLDDKTIKVLKKLKHLRHMRLIFTYSSFNMFYSIEHLVQLKDLTHLRIGFIQYDYDDTDDEAEFGGPPRMDNLRTLAVGLPGLLKLKIEECRITNKLAVGFLQMARNLEKFTMDDCCFRILKNTTKRLRRARNFAMRDVVKRKNLDICIGPYYFGQKKQEGRFVLTIE